MRDDQRQRIRLRRADMVEVDVLAIDLSGELGEAVEAGFGGPPVKAVSPVGAQFLKVGAFGTIVPAGAVQLIRKPRVGQSCLQIDQHCLGDVTAERLEGVAHHGLRDRIWVLADFA